LPRIAGVYAGKKKECEMRQLACLVLIKSDQKACQWAFLSAMATLQDRAIKEGGNAVVNIHRYYYKNTFSSSTEFECGAGAVMSGVTMVGDVVKLAE